jgi:hypothetical protein
MVGEPDATMQPASQDNQLMSKHRVLSFKPYLRLERRGQDGQNETEQPDHSASLGDSIASSTRIRFSVHTGGNGYVLPNATAPHLDSTIGAILTERQSLPVYPDKQTISEPVGTSHSCQMQTCWLIRSRRRRWPRAKAEQTSRSILQP